MDMIFYIAAGWNFFVLLLYGFDKLAAIRGARRVREAVLLLCSFLCGGIGAIMGMVLFRHKTNKMKFRLAVPLSLLLTLTVLILVRIHFPS